MRQHCEILLLFTALVFAMLCLVLFYLNISRLTHRQDLRALKARQRTGTSVKPEHAKENNTQDLN
jgi:hypothetical protein